MKASMFAAPAVMMLYSKFGKDITEPQILAGYGTAVALVLAALAYIYLKVQASNDRGEVTVKVKKANGTTETENKTVAEYDAGEVRNQLIKVVMGTAIVGALYYYKGVLQALVIQAVMLPLNLFEAGIFKVHVLGEPAAGKLARPFKEDNPFAAFTEAQTAAKEKADEPVADTPASEDGSEAPKAAGKTAFSASEIGVAKRR
ncbi:hypothetical protein WJX72_011852 [[Myrmecia] bisecta]|uniref:Uncharacterized protein n=1 Tax=[Myrmecia] bisecta TaxID=41462 RepID=A0AAW1PZI2_9CHLO